LKLAARIPGKNYVEPVGQGTLVNRNGLPGFAAHYHCILAWLLFAFLNAEAESRIEEASFPDELVVRDCLLSAGGHAGEMLEVLRNHRPWKAPFEANPSVFAVGNDQ
jgi:hypothetical protein